MVRARHDDGSVEVHDRRPALGSLVAPERHLRTGRAIVADRADKHEGRTRPRRRPTKWVVGGGVAVVLLCAGGVLLATRSPKAPVIGYDLSATWTEIEGFPPEGVDVGLTDRVTIGCTEGECSMAEFGWDWRFPAETASLDFDGSFSHEPATSCDPVFVTFGAARADDGSYSGTLVSEPTALTAEDLQPDGSTLVCQYYRYTQAVTMTPIFG